MFTKNDVRLFILAAAFLIAGFVSLAIDPHPQGFGSLTLWLAPPLLLVGFILVIPAIARKELKSMLRQSWDTDRSKFFISSVMILISFILYMVTLEPTASLWDCSEFIASSYKLQVPHTPGNPFLLLIGRIFSMLSFGDGAKVAICLNAMSALFSALTIGLIYLLLVHLIDRIDPHANKLVRAIAASTGSLIVAFSDTFWYSSVEAETYAASCFFFFLLIALTLKGMQLEGVDKTRTLLLILYLAGLAYCVHPLCLLALPILCIAWFLRDRKITARNLTLSVAGGIGLVLGINRLIAVGVFEGAFIIDKFFVNVLGMPFYSGAIIFGVAAIIMVRLLLRRGPTLFRGTWCMVFFIAGFLPYLILFIRSNHNPPIDEANPENLQLIKAYMNREGYPTRPLVYGPYFDAEITGVSAGETVYFKGHKKYEIAGTMSSYEYQKGRQTLLPRIYSNDQAHIESYRQWCGLREGEKPGFIHNLLFMFRYQLGHMYFRYILFNFSGRTSDEQNSPAMWPWSASDDSEFRSRAENQYWMVPLLLGIAGMAYQIKNDPKGFIVVAGTFLITGAVLAVYLNSTPDEPRERDYIYVTSYVAFGLWTGIGVISIFRNTKRLHILSGIMLLVPLLMFIENYDDHNRTDRTFQIDNARNLLNSCAADAILFTGGDNDTFPLWYLQEVEGFRTDVRVMVLSYLNTDWYINQIRNHYYDSKPFNLSLSREDYRQYGPNDVLYVNEQFKSPVDAAKLLALLHQQHQALQIRNADGDYNNSVPSKKLLVTTPGTDSSFVLNITDRYLAKNTLAIIDILLNNPSRPMYFNFTSMIQTGTDLHRYLVQEGQLFRVRPETSSSLDTELAFRNLVELADYSNLLNEKVYFTFEDHELRIIHPLRQLFNALADELIKINDKEKANKVLDQSLRYFYNQQLRPSFANLQTANLLVKLGRVTDAAGLASRLYAYNDHRIRQGNDGPTEQQLRSFAEEFLSHLPPRTHEYQEPEEGSR